MPRDETGSDAPLYRAVRAWNDALARHDLKKLETIYADEVFFYGFKRSRADVLRAKKAEFDRQPNFAQEIIGNIELYRAVDDSVFATFVKKGATLDGFLVADAKVVLRGDPLLVIEESDATSLQEQRAIPDGCYEKTHEVVSAIPEVMRIRAETKRQWEQSDGGQRYGGWGPGPKPNDEGGWESVEGLYIEEHLNIRVAYEVDRSGHLTVRVQGLEVAPSKAGLEAVKRACRH